MNIGVSPPRTVKRSCIYTPEMGQVSGDLGDIWSMTDYTTYLNLLLIDQNASMDSSPSDIYIYI